MTYDFGAVRVVFPLPGSGDHAQDPGPSSPFATAEGVTPDSLFNTDGCPYGTGPHWSCFYQDANFGGTMTEFEDCDYEQDFSDYSFNNQTSLGLTRRTTRL